MIHGPWDRSDTVTLAIFVDKVTMPAMSHVHVTMDHGLIDHESYDSWFMTPWLCSLLEVSICSLDLYSEFRFRSLAEEVFLDLESNDFWQMHPVAAPQGSFAKSHFDSIRRVRRLCPIWFIEDRAYGLGPMSYVLTWAEIQKLAPLWHPEKGRFNSKV